MKKIVLSIISIISLQLSAQTTLLQETFTAYNGTATTTAAGFKTSGLATTFGNYTTAASSGPSGPNSFKFQGATNALSASLYSPAFSNGNDTLTFWIKGNSTSPTSKLTIYESLDSLAWTVVDSIKPLPTTPATGVIKKYGLLSTTKWVKFEYYKAAGNLAFDDVNIIQYPPFVAPTAAFTSDAPVCSGDTIQFTDATTGSVSSWAWDFGDGNTSTLQNPTHVYASNGNYTVTLIANPGTASADTTTNTITAFVTPPSYSFTYANAYINAPTSFYSTVNTTNSTCTVNGYLWTFGDPASGSLDTATTANPQHNYTVAGTYTIKLKVQFSCAVNCGTGSGLDSVEYQLVVGPSPMIQGLFNAPSVCEPQCVQLSDAGSFSTYAPINSWIWDFGDGSPTYSGQNPPCHTYAVPGGYTVSLTVTDDSSHTYIGTQSITYNALPIVNIMTSSTTVCQFNSTCFNPMVTSTFGGPINICQYIWDFGDGQFDNSPTPCHVYQFPGTYTVTLTAMSCEGCVGIGNAIIIVDQLPTSNFSEADCGALTKCFTDLSSGAVAAWNWNFGDSNTSTLQNPTHAYASAGNYTVSLKVTTTSGCQDSLTLTVTVPPTIGLNELSHMSSANVYAANQHINISIHEKLNATITVYSIDGQLISEEKMVDATNLSIDMSGKSEGLYLVVISNKESKIARKVNLSK